MSQQLYELTQSVGPFDAGETVVCTAAYGGWHPYDVKLEPAADTTTGSVELSHRKFSVVT